VLTGFVSMGAWRRYASTSFKELYPVQERNGTPMVCHPRTKVGLMGEFEILLSAGGTKKRVHTRLIKLRISFKDNDLDPYSKAI
jgi:hypothetical protein